MTEELSQLHWPADRSTLSRLNGSDLIYWYASLDKREVVYMSQDPEFIKFWNAKYLRPLRIKRMWLKIRKFIGLA